MITIYKNHICEDIISPIYCQTLQDLTKLSENIKFDQLVKMITFTQKQYIFWQLKEKLYSDSTEIKEFSFLLSILYKFSREDFLTCQILILDQEFLNFLLNALSLYTQQWEQHDDMIYVNITAKILCILNNVCIDFQKEYIQFQEKYLEQYIQCIQITSGIFKEYLQKHGNQKHSQDIEILISQYLKYIRLAVQNIKDPRLIEYVVDIMLVLPVGFNQFENLLRYIGGLVNDRHLILLEHQMNMLSSQYSTLSIQQFLIACIDNDQISPRVLQNHINTYIAIKMNKQQSHIITTEELHLVNWLIEKHGFIKDDVLYQLIQYIIYTVRTDNYQLYKETLFNILNMLQQNDKQFTVDFILYNLYSMYKTSILLQEAVAKFTNQSYHN